MNYVTTLGSLIFFIFGVWFVALPHIQSRNMVCGR